MEQEDRLGFLLLFLVYSMSSSPSEMLAAQSKIATVVHDV